MDFAIRHHVHQSGAVRNNGNTAENRRPSAKDILRVNFRSISQVLGGLPPSIIKLGVNYCQDCAQNCIGFQDGI